MIRVIIVEDMPLLRSALVALLSLEADIEVVAEVGRGDDLISSAVAFEPDVIIIDIDIPGMDGLMLASVLHQRLPQCRSLILAGLSRPGSCAAPSKPTLQDSCLKRPRRAGWRTRSGALPRESESLTPTPPPKPSGRPEYR